MLRDLQWPAHRSVSNGSNNERKLRCECLNFMKAVVVVSNQSILPVRQQKGSLSYSIDSYVDGS